MGSLSASGIPVVIKQPYSFRKFDIDIEWTDNRNDTVSGVVTWNPELNRPITSGSIVREGGVASYFEDLSLGAYIMGRSSEDRIASATSGVDRVRVVNLAGNQTQAVIESGLTPYIPQRSTYNAGNKVVRRSSHNDSLIDRVDN